MDLNEHIHSFANRMIFSRSYRYALVALVLMSFVILIVNIIQACPSRLIVALEVLINLAMIAETGLRILALRKVQPS